MNFAHGIVEVSFIKETGVVPSGIADLRGIGNNEFVDSFCRIGHVTPSFEMSLFKEKRHCSTVIQMETDVFLKF